MAIKQMRQGSAGLALAVCAFASATVAAQPVAIVTDVQGTAAYGSAATPVGILTQLDAGNRLRLSPGARVTLLYYADGTQFDIGGPGSVRLDASRPQSSDGATIEPRQTGATSAVRLKSGGLVQGAMVMRNLGLRIVAPDALVLATQPELAWTDSRSEASYEVALIDAEGKRVYAATTTARSATLPANVALEPGRSYAVEVAASVRGERVQTARAEFSVAAEELRAQARALAPAADAPVAERVAYALWLDQNDLHAEARRWWTGLAQTRPEQSSLRERAGAR
jgi:hypothetical protein